MKDPNAPSPYSLVVVSVGEHAPATYSLEEAARIARVHPDRLRHYCRLGLFGSALARADIEPVFDDDQLYEVRRFEHFRQHHGVNQKTLRLLSELWREVERLREELRFFRGR